MDREWPASCSSFSLHVMEHARTQLMHVHITIWSVHACRRSKQPRSARIHLGAHICRHTHVARSPSPAPWLPSGWFVSRDPGYSARLNKSHQVGSDSSHVDGTPNVIWRLGEHEIGPSSASSDTLSRCDVVLSLDASVLSFFFVTHTHPHTLTHTLSSTQNNPNTHFDTLCRLTYYPSVQNGGHQFNPPPHPLHIPPPLVCFVLHVPFPLRIPVIPLVTVVIVMHPCLKSCQRTSCLSHTHTQAHSCTHMNDKTQINKLMNTLTRPTSPSLIHTYSCNILACLSTCLSVCLEEVRCVISVINHQQW